MPKVTIQPLNLALEAEDGATIIEAAWLAEPGRGAASRGMLRATKRRATVAEGGHDDSR